MNNQQRTISVETPAAADEMNPTESNGSTRSRVLVRELAIEIVDFFIKLLREDEIPDAVREVYDRLQTRLPFGQPIDLSVTPTSEENP